MIELDFSKPKDDIYQTLTSLNDVWVAEITDFINEWWDDKDFIVAETSGSTGIPKKVELDKVRVINSALATGDFFDFKEGENALLCISPKFIAGKLMIVRAIVWKLNLICVEPNSTPLDSFSGDVSINFAAMVPLQLQNSISELSSKRVKKLIVGGGAVDISLMQQLANSDTEIYSSYGMTETITHIALKRLNGLNSDNKFRALDDVYFEVDDRNCLVIHAAKISRDKVVTNDIVELKNDKEFNWIGRYDNVINSGGVKIFPEKIEEILSKEISSTFFIGSVKDERLGERVVLVIDGNSEKVDLESIKSLLPKYHSPKEVFYLDKFIRTDSGKINRKKTLEKLK
jgi:O-succinylbenzoic acid--CoA ligase